MTGWKSRQVEISIYGHTSLSLIAEHPIVNSDCMKPSALTGAPFESCPKCSIDQNGVRSVFADIHERTVMLDAAIPE
jgi:hypothetical protein